MGDTLWIISTGITALRKALLTLDAGEFSIKIEVSRDVFRAIESDLSIATQGVRGLLAEPGEMRLLGAAIVARPELRELTFWDFCEAAW